MCSTIQSLFQISPKSLVFYHIQTFIQSFFTNQKTHNECRHPHLSPFWMITKSWSTQWSTLCPKGWTLKAKHSCQHFPLQPPPSTSPVAGDTARSGMAFIWSSGVLLINSPEWPWISLPSSLVIKEGSWSEISLVMITSAITQLLAELKGILRYSHPIWYYTSLLHNYTHF